MMSPDDAKRISRDLPIYTSTVAKGGESADSSLHASSEVTETTVTDAAPQDITKPTEATAKLKSKTRYLGPATKKEEVTLQQIADKLKTRRYKGPKGKRGQGKPTGFEPWHCDGPLTPDEYNEDRIIYDSARPFIVRVEEALMRFDRLRRMEPDRRHVFHKYLAYGGIATGHNYGNGLSSQDLKDLSEEDAMRARTQLGIHRERENMEINFKKVVQGFLGSFYVGFFSPYREKDIELATITIRSFLLYLLFHDVCPEFKDNILQARAVCDCATKELWMNLSLQSEGPGKFNKACSFLFAGHHFDLRSNASGWGDITAEKSPMTLKNAQQIIKYGITFGAAYEVYERFKGSLEGNEDKLSVMQILDIDGFEIVSIEKPAPHVLVNYEKHAAGQLPVGIIHAKSFRDPARPEIDLNLQERQEWDNGNAPEYELTFLLESNLLELCCPGTKVITSVWELSCGLHYFDQIMKVYPTFYAPLYNEMMLHWKVPKDIPNPALSSNEEQSRNVYNEIISETTEPCGLTVNEADASKTLDQTKRYVDSDTEFDF